MSIQILVLSEGDWILPDGIIVCEVTQEQFEQLENGTSTGDLHLTGIELGDLLPENKIDTEATIHTAG